jgi:hypothetical protein
MHLRAARAVAMVTDPVVAGMVMTRVPVVTTRVHVAPVAVALQAKVAIRVAVQLAPVPTIVVVLAPNARLVPHF